MKLFGKSPELQMRGENPSRRDLPIEPRSGLTKTEVEDLLDWYEAQGVRHLQVSYRAKEGFQIKSRLN